MARKKARKSAPRRRSSTKRAAPRRRRSSGPRGGLSFANVMKVATPIVLGGAGFLAAGYVANKVLTKQSPKARAGILAAGGAVLAVMAPSLAPVAVGMGIQGTVQLATTLFPDLTAPAQINGPNADDIRLLEALAVNGIDGMINGDVDGMINGVGEDSQPLDRARI
jgi:hypothetical protein